MKEVRVSLNEQMFRQLVAGQVVDATGSSSCCLSGQPNKVKVFVALQDIGFDRILEAVQEAMSK